MMLLSKAEQKLKLSKNKSKAFVILALSVMLSMLTGCGSVLSLKKHTLSIYQPSVLNITAGTEIQTLEGVYEAQTNEVWHSDKRFRELERQVISQ